MSTKARIHFNTKKDLSIRSPLCGEFTLYTTEGIGDGLTRKKGEMTCGICMIKYRRVRDRVMRERHRIDRTPGGMGT